MPVGGHLTIGMLSYIVCGIVVVMQGGITPMCAALTADI